MFPNKFFSRDGRLLCTRHGAKFMARDGLCVAGPCTGDALNELPLEPEAAGVVARWTSLRALCNAVELVDAGDPRASGPAVSRPEDERPAPSRARSRGAGKARPRAGGDSS
jgi:hypothetical protein